VQTRFIAIGLIAVLAAFAVAFGAGKATSKTSTAGAGVSAEVIDVVAPAAITAVEVGGAMPALKSAAKKARAKKKASAPKKSSGSTSKPSTPRSTPSTPAPSKPAPSAPTAPAPKAPAPKAPAPKAPTKPAPAPVTGGGDEG